MSYFPLFLPCQEREEAHAILKGFVELMEDEAARATYKEDIDKMKLYCEKFIEKYNKAYNAI